MSARILALSENSRKALLSRARRLRDAVISNALTGGNPLHAIRVPADARRLSSALTDRTVLVSGASSGIGRAVALKAASAGARVVLVARSAERLRALETEIIRKGGKARFYAADLSSSTSSAELLSRLATDGVVVDVLINNAGRSIRRSLDESCERLHDFERTMALNYFGSLRLILALLPGMRDRRYGHVINVSSAGAQVATPMFSAYVASKSALDAFTRVAATEVHGEGVHFTTVNMPLVRTPMIAPTDEYRHAPALTPEQAADLVLRPLVTFDRRIGLPLAALIDMGHAVMPKALEALIGYAHRVVSAPCRDRAAEESAPGSFCAA